MSLAHSVAETMMQKDCFSQLLGLELIEATAEHCLMALDVTQQHLNGHGICHGGVYFTLADTAFAHLCNADNRVTVAQMCQISFVQPAKFKDRLLARAECTAHSGRSGVYDIRVEREADQALLAVFRGHSRTISGNVIQEENEGDENGN